MDEEEAEQVGDEKRDNPPAEQTKQPKGGEFYLSVWRWQAI
ncbi:MAG: hypothetical protein ACQEV0_01140 [Bacillota bacterium]